VQFEQRLRHCLRRGEGGNLQKTKAGTASGPRGRDRVVFLFNQLASLFVNRALSRLDFGFGQAQDPVL